MKIDIDTGVVEHVDKNTDCGICSQVITNLMEGIQSATLSQHGELGSISIIILSSISKISLPCNNPHDYVERQFNPHDYVERQFREPRLHLHLHEILARILLQVSEKLHQLLRLMLENSIRQAAEKMSRAVRRRRFRHRAVRGGP